VRDRANRDDPVLATSAALDGLVSKGEKIAQLLQFRIKSRAEQSSPYAVELYTDDIESWAK